MQQNEIDQLNLGSTDAGKEIIIRKGEALKLQPPRKVELSGSIKAPVEYITKRKADHLPNTVHVIYDKEAGTIELVADELNHYARLIKGTLSLNPKLKPFKINEGGETAIFKDLKSVVKLIRFNKWIFADETRYQELIDALQKFEVKVQAEIKNIDNGRGNIEKGVKQTVQVNADLTFTASAAIFLGSEVSKFKVEIVTEIRTGAIDYWFESVELEQLMIGQREVAMNEQLELLKEYVSIEK